MNLLDRFARSLAIKAAPVGADLYPPRNTGGAYGLIGSAWDYGGAGPLAFPGWPDRMTSTQPTASQKPYIGMTSPWFYGNVKAIAGESGVMELEVGERSDTEDDQAEPSPIAYHPLEKIWTHPNPFMGRVFVSQFWVWQMYLYGKAFLYFAPDQSTGELMEMWPIPAPKMKPIGTVENFIDHYEYRVNERERIIIPSEYVCYSRFINPFDPREGLPPLLAAFNGIDTDLAMAKWNANFFGPENAIPTAIATLSDSTSDPDFFRIRQDLLENFGRGKRKLLVTRGSDIDFKILQFNPEQMMFDKLREISRMEIDRACGLPDGFWTSRANRANSEHADSVIINTIIWPLAVGLAEDLNAQIVPHHYGDNIIASFKDIRTRNVQQELEELRMETSIFTIAEMRMRHPAPEVTETGWINGDPNDPRNNMFVAELKPETIGVTATAPASVTPVVAAPNPIDQTAEIAKHLQQWQSKAIKRLKDKRRAACAFDSDLIPATEQARITAALAGCKSAEDVRAVFAATTIKPVTAADVVSAIRDATKLLEAAQ